MTATSDTAAPARSRARGGTSVTRGMLDVLAGWGVRRVHTNVGMANALAHLRARSPAASQAFGVPARRVTGTDGLPAALAEAEALGGPAVVEALTGPCSSEATVETAGAARAW